KQKKNPPHRRLKPPGPDGTRCRKLLRTPPAPAPRTPRRRFHSPLSVRELLAPRSESAPALPNRELLSWRKVTCVVRCSRERALLRYPLQSASAVLPELRGKGDHRTAAPTPLLPNTPRSYGRLPPAVFLLPSLCRACFGVSFALALLQFRFSFVCCFLAESGLPMFTA
ncbi:MAG: hypothetical protein BJ554DRAFT_1225, partial [Olpidium bornovanus]